ncbi:hypothetical protein Hypma_004999 [Hypsizygus marmoreus]|uniref:Uncharacterized protein n=1 Tax=Hypsizygus marmoreus TaxID=39966 RepID=A0A369JYZ9_HYPMA|nr:hypothetical protein Hypma_004999 [Hypsizygus marmoreus]
MLFATSSLQDSSSLRPYAVCRGRRMCTVEVCRVLFFQAHADCPPERCDENLASGCATYWVHHRRIHLRPLSKDAIPAKTPLSIESDDSHEQTANATRPRSLTTVPTTSTTYISHSYGCCPSASQQ